MRHLRIVVAVADELHFGRAARRLTMAQPPVSQAVRRVEKELGVELFDRSRRQIRLTPGGAVVLDEIRQLLAREDRLRALARRAGEGALGVLRAGVPPAAGAGALAELMDACARAGLEVDLLELTTDEQIRLLLSGGLDAGLLQLPADTAGLRTGPVAEAPLGVVLPRTSPLARLASLSLADLAGNDLVLFPRSHAADWYDDLLAVCRTEGFVPGRIRHAADPEFQLALVTAGRGVAFDAGPVARKEPRVTWRPLTGRPLVRRLAGVWPESAHPAARTFTGVAARALAGGAPDPYDRGRSEGTDRPWAVVFE
ncbi:LysR substrate-binding domain-containing protein [Streptomyces smaragdinus]|uniref:LysR substrate-binding domain-containing protein n=1 Tax=Streptomyces smaragdinus TaxID=2585196 RepID=UPI0018865B1D|nr:LysR substrate-binding domain-containing protein [Streptomyces smaragdinus]